ncbi:hypothetical protein BGX34_000490 [Mortierella sp. NVP85]|nr:hypothetical protein BGX34_000490 [Mortierella sp. NVP85]
MNNSRYNFNRGLFTRIHHTYRTSRFARCNQYFESQLTWTPTTPEERQVVNLMSTSGPGSFYWSRHNHGHGPHTYYEPVIQSFTTTQNFTPNGDRSRGQGERRDRAKTAGKAKSKGSRKNKKATPETKLAIVEYKKNNPDSSFREIAEKFKLAKTTAHRIIAKMRPNKQPCGETPATSRCAGQLGSRELPSPAMQDDEPTGPYRSKEA